MFVRDSSRIRTKPLRIASSLSASTIRFPVAPPASPVAITGCPRRLIARAMLTPLPPGIVVCSTGRCRRPGVKFGTSSVLSSAAFSVTVMIIAACLPRPAAPRSRRPSAARTVASPISAPPPRASADSVAGMISDAPGGMLLRIGGRRRAPAAAGSGSRRGRLSTTATSRRPCRGAAGPVSDAGARTLSRDRRRAREHVLKVEAAITACVRRRVAVIAGRASTCAGVDRRAQARSSRIRSRAARARCASRAASLEVPSTAPISVMPSLRARGDEHVAGAERVPGLDAVDPRESRRPGRCG